MVIAPIHHVSLDERGVAYVTGTTIKVADVAVDATVWGHTPEQIQQEYPRLSLAQIHAALAYYHDHRAEIDPQLDEAEREVAQLREAHPNPLSRDQLEQRRRSA